MLDRTGLYIDRNCPQVMGTEGVTPHGETLPNRARECDRCTTTGSGKNQRTHCPILSSFPETGTKITGG
eukprot:SAG11_NODE_6423_length_1317_cov_1.053366_1_plen_68_part_10